MSYEEKPDVLTFTGLPKATLPASPRRGRKGQMGSRIINPQPAPFSTYELPWYFLARSAKLLPRAVIHVAATAILLRTFAILAVNPWVVRGRGCATCLCPLGTHGVSKVLDLRLHPSIAWRRERLSFLTLIEGEF